MIFLFKCFIYWFVFYHSVMILNPIFIDFLIDFLSEGSNKND